MYDIPCDIIRDLLPLYVDDVCSEQSKKMVEEHISWCQDCQHYYESLQKELPQITLPEDDSGSVSQESLQIDVRFIKNIRKKITERQLIFGGIVAVALLFVLAAAYSAGLLEEGMLRRIPLFDRRLKAEDMQVTELYQLDNGSVYFTLKSDKKFTTASCANLVPPPDKWGISSGECSAEIFLNYSFWKEHFTNSTSQREATFLLPLSETYQNYGGLGQTITLENSAIYYIGKGDERMTIWERGQKIEQAPAAIEKIADQEYKKSSTGVSDNATYEPYIIFRETEE